MEPVDEDNNKEEKKEKEKELEKLKNIRKIINSIPEETYKNLFKGRYNKSKKYIPKKVENRLFKNYK